MGGKLLLLCLDLCDDVNKILLFILVAGGNSYVVEPYDYALLAFILLLRY